MEHRKHKRIAVEGFTVDVSDGVGFGSGYISDISRSGMCLTDIPSRLKKTAKMTVVVSGHGKNFKLLVTPKWMEENGARRDVGVKIDATSGPWTGFVMNRETKGNIDVWGSTS